MARPAETPSPVSLRTRRNTLWEWNGQSDRRKASHRLSAAGHSRQSAEIREGEYSKMLIPERRDSSPKGEENSTRRKLLSRRLWAPSVRWSRSQADEGTCRLASCRTAV